MVAERLRPRRVSLGGESPLNEGGCTGPATTPTGGDAEGTGDTCVGDSSNSKDPPHPDASHLPAPLTSSSSSLMVASSRIHRMDLPDQQLSVHSFFQEADRIVQGGDVAAGAAPAGSNNNVHDVDPTAGNQGAAIGPGSSPRPQVDAENSETTSRPAATKRRRVDNGEGTEPSPRPPRTGGRSRCLRCPP